MGKVVSIADYTKKDEDKYIKDFESIITEYNNTGDIAIASACYSIYKEKRMCYQIAIDIVSKNNKMNINSLGFTCVLEEFKDSKIIRDFMAKCMLEEIYSTIGLEEYLHERFKSKGELTKKDIKKYIVDAIYGYDKELHDYLLLNLDLTKEVVEEFKYIIRRWDSYEEKSYINLDEICDFICEFKEIYKCRWSSEELLYYMKLEMGIDCTQAIENEIRNMFSVLGKNMLTNDEVVNLTYMQDLFKTSIGKETFSDCSVEDYRALFVFKNEIENFIKNKRIPAEFRVREK